MVLSEKTNTPMHKKDSDRHTLIKYLKDTIKHTPDKPLAYDLTKCIMILNNEDPEDIKELKCALEEVCVQKEVLEDERNQLVMENENLKSMINK